MTLQQNNGSLTTREVAIREYGNFIATKNLTTMGGVKLEELKIIGGCWNSESLTGNTTFRNMWSLRPKSISGSPGTLLDVTTLEHVFLPTESPFDELYELRSDEEKVRDIIAFLTSQNKISFAKKLADRIKFLVDAAKEEYPDEIPIVSQSLKHFIAFIRSMVNLNYPDVVLSPSKNIRAQWRSGANRHFAVEFLPTGDAQFVIFAPDPKHSRKIIRLSGLSSVDSLMETAQPHGVLNWCSQ